MFGLNNDPLMRGSLSVSSYLACKRYASEYRKAHPLEFQRSGIVVFCGSQGSGKTLSAVNYVQHIARRYPDSILVSNIDISGLPDGYTVLPYDGLNSLTSVNNGEFGVVYLIDEIHLEFNSLESKSVPIEVFTEISQQRKQRKHIVATSQLFLRLAKPFREQAAWIVLCRQLFPYLQFNTVLDGSSVIEDSGGVSGSVLNRSFWFHTPELYASYDTYSKVRRLGNVWKENHFGPVNLPYSELFRGSGGGVGG